MLGVARTLTSAVRLLEALELLRGDLRIQVLFAVDATSAFAEGTAGLLADVGARVVPWEQLVDADVDLVVTASENVDLGAVRAPVVVLPHGVGFHRCVPDSNGPGTRLSGLVPRQYRAGREVRLVASHPDQVAQLAAADPDAAARATVVGDVCFDRLLASRRLRPAYRRRLGVDDDRRLVVLSSTWGRRSLLGSWPELPARLLGQLPVDEYRVAMILHPNVWSRHSPWQVRAWLADARDAGLLLVPPTSGWQACVVAADVVVGDHGSVTFYAAALGVPVLLAAFGDDEAVPGTPLAELARRAPRLRSDHDLHPQLDAATAAHDPTLARALTDATFAHTGEVQGLLRGLLYRQVGLPEPNAPAAARAWPVPEPEAVAVRSFAVVTTLLDPGTVEVERYPARLASLPDESATVCTHRAAYDDEPDPVAAESASVIVREPVTDVPRASAWTTETLRRYPGARIAAAATAGGCCLLTVRGDRTVLVSGGTPGVRVDPMLLTAVGYARLRAGVLDDGPVRLITGGRQALVEVTTLGG